jgi:SAM-dependent methyltransferase
MGRRAERSPFQGVFQIVAFNWPRYAAAVPLIAGLATALALMRFPAPVAFAGWLAAGLLSWWTLASLGASHWVYDRAGLYELRWLDGLLGSPRHWVSIHAGLDEFSGTFESRFGTPPLAVLDVYDPSVMTEASIARAHSEGGVRADYRNLPLESATADAVFLMLAAHELRSREPRVAFFEEVRRTLAPGGRVMVVEHLRDAWNFAAFGPGWWHFLSRREWLATFRAAGLRVESESTITPLVRVFVLWRDTR